MKIFIADYSWSGLPFAMLCDQYNHDVRIYFTPNKGNKTDIGKGIVNIVDKIEPSMDWADLIIITDNSKSVKELQYYFDTGYPIVGSSWEQAQWEIVREEGQNALKAAGIKTLPFKAFTSYQTAIDYVKKEERLFVCKPNGDIEDKSLSYVPKRIDDLISRLEHWKAGAKKQPSFILQECVEDGVEMGVGGWFGPGGWNSCINENWEEKRLLHGGLGQNCGEMGTILRYVQQSPLFEAVLRPMTKALSNINYVGYCDVNCLIDKSGQPWPLEFTMRFGWPHFDLCQILHLGDPVLWLWDLYNGRDSLMCSPDIAVGVVMATGDYPWDLAKDQHKWPIRGLPKELRKNIALTGVCLGTFPEERNGKIIDTAGYVTCQNYVLLASGKGDTVKSAQNQAYKVVERIGWPPHQTYRTDIGDRLEKELPKIQAKWAKGVVYG